MKKIFSIIMLLVTTLCSATTYHIATNGNDNNPGTLSQPWATWAKIDDAFLNPGDNVIVHGGIYFNPVTTGAGLDKEITGTSTDSIIITNAPGEVPILDCSNVTDVVTGDHHALIWHLTYARVTGLTVRNVWQTSPSIEVQAWGIVGINSVVDNCTVYNTHGRGFWSINSNQLLFKNCDAYNNCDSMTSVLAGNDGYGWFIEDQTGTNGSVYLRQCRAWLCGDDGFTCYSEGYVEFDRCWSFNNGQLEGEGHGFKLGWLNTESANLRRLVKNCIAVNNKSDGINTNDEPGTSPAAVMNVFNNTCYNNTTSSVGGDAYGIIIFNTGSVDARELGRVFRNNLTFNNTAGDIFVGENALYTHSYNSFEISVTVTADDFVSLDDSYLDDARSSVGYLPDLHGYLKLTTGSDLIDAGINVGLAYNGVAPDLGWSEYIEEASNPVPPRVFTIGKTRRDNLIISRRNKLIKL